MASVWLSRKANTTEAFFFVEKLSEAPKCEGRLTIYLSIVGCYIVTYIELKSRSGASCFTI